VPEITAAIIGAIASIVLMTFGSINRRREKDITEIFRRLNQLEKSVVRLEESKKYY
tara:strand:- start:685 stop:852 length:168 start_codon:yes stop_codon:yes gene_type:complete